MSDFTKSIVYSGFVLVAGLIAIFAISSNMTASQTGALSFAGLEPAAGEEMAIDGAVHKFDSNNIAITEGYDPETDQEAEWNSDEALEKLRAALIEAGIDVSKTEPAAGGDSDVIVDTTSAE